MNRASTCAAPRPRLAPRQPPRPAPRCERCSYLKSLLGAQRDVRLELAGALCVLLAARRAEQVRERREAAPPHDPEAERVVLGAAMRHAEVPPAPELFAEPVHAAIATAIGTGRLDEVLLYPEVRAYRRHVAQLEVSPAELQDAIERVYELAARREALARAEEAIRVLRTGGSCARAAAELRGALAALEGEVTP